MSAADALADSIERCYVVFATYRRPPKVSFCTFCYDSDQIELLRTTPLRHLDLELSRLLAWEAYDHFETTDIYKHYLPRILEYLAPPTKGEDIYPEHLFDCLKAHGFHDWPPAEREAFWSYVVAVDHALEEIDPRQARGWRISAGKIAGSPYPNDGLLSTDPPE